MIKLGKIQYKVLEAAAARPGGALLPLPDAINLKGGAPRDSMPMYGRPCPVSSTPQSRAYS